MEPCKRFGLAWMLVLVWAVACSSATNGGAGGPEGGSGGSGGADAGGAGGAGAAGGSGGAGGTGGCGDATPSCVPACNDGETCAIEACRATCECSPSPDSCPRGWRCNDQRRCEPDYPLVENAPCGETGQTATDPDGAPLFCTDLLSNRGPRWLRVCHSPADCPLPHSICLGEMVGYRVAPYCMTNRCGASANGPRLSPPLPPNGEPFGPCSASKGYVGMGALEDGTCVPQTMADGTVGGVCTRTGTAPKAGPCRLDARRDDAAALCGADAVCIGYRVGQPRPCTTDDACTDLAVTIGMKTQRVDGYCGYDGTCWARGVCGDLCNAGTVGAANHPNAGCTDPVGTCTDLSGATDPYPVLEGYCEAPCTLFAAQACPDYPAGQPRTCEPSFVPDAPLAGTCLPRAAAPRALGEECSADPFATECPDGAACLATTTGQPSRCLAWCDCEAGFDGTTNTCRDAATNAACAPAGTACRRVTSSSPIGLCLAD
jgi:hypothetical protein